MNETPIVILNTAPGTGLIPRSASERELDNLSNIREVEILIKQTRSRLAFLRRQYRFLMEQKNE